MPTRVELDHFLAHAARSRGPTATRRSRACTASPRRARRATTSCVFAFDHRNQFFELAQEAGAGEERLPQLKKLLRRRGRARPSARAGSPATSASCATTATARTRSTPRPAAAGGSAGRSSCRARDPLVFDRGALARHDADRLAARARRQVPRRLPPRRRGRPPARERGADPARCARRRAGERPRAAARDHPAARRCRAQPDTVLRALKRLYNLGIQPEWWKLEPMARAPSGGAVDALIAERDPYCRGVRAARPERSRSRRWRQGFRDARAQHDRAAASRSGRTIFHDAGARLARRRDRRRDVQARAPRDVRGADRRAGSRRVPERAERQHERNDHRSADDGAGAGALPGRAALRVERRRRQRLFGGVWAIFGHGNVAGLGEALYAHRDALPTYRAHNEQAMAHAAIAYAKAHMRRRMMAVHDVDRARRDQPGHRRGAGARQPAAGAAAAGRRLRLARARPGAAAGRGLRRRRRVGATTASARCRATSTASCSPEQLLTALPRALHVLTDPALCGPVTLALPQDVQTMAFDWPEDVLRAARRCASPRPRRTTSELAGAVAMLRERASGR